MRIDSRMGWAAWVVPFVGFILGGARATAGVEAVARPLASLLADLVAGAVIGTPQWRVLRPEFPGSGSWAVATAVGLGLGPAGGAALVNYRYDQESIHAT